MTSVSAPTPRAVTKRRSRGFGPMVGAVALVLVAGAAIATGIAVNSGDTTTQAAQSIYLNDLEALLNENPAVANAARADAVHTGQLGGTSSPDLSTYEGMVAAGIIPEAFDPATDLRTYEGLVAAGIIPPAFEAPSSAAVVTESPLFGSPETWYQQMFGDPELDHFRSINEIPEPTPAPFVQQPGSPQ